MKGFLDKMEIFYPFFISFAMIFVSELGDKTQLLVLSFSGKDKTYKILFGVALGSFFSHGLAILFGSSIGVFENPLIHNIIEIITFSSFILMGIISLLPKKEVLTMNEDKTNGILTKISRLKINYSILIALCIMFGELGDKTFLASIGLGVQYPNFKLSLILGAISAMVVCNFIAIIFGKFLNKHISYRKYICFISLLIQPCLQMKKE